MSRLIILILGLLTASAALAQQANFNYLSQTVTAVVSPSALNLANAAPAFTNVVTQQTGRQSCWIQYKPITPGTGIISTTNQGFVFFGTTAPLTVQSAIVLNAFELLTCEDAAEVDGSGIWVSSTTTSDNFIVKWK